MMEERPIAWAGVLRSALLFSPFFVVALVVMGIIVREIASEGMSGGRLIGIVLVGLMALLLGYQILQSVRDLFAGLVETTGLVERRWSRSDFFLFRNDYIFVHKNVYRLHPEQYVEVGLGDTVRIVHFPHTSAVEAIEVLKRDSSADEQR